MRHKHIKWLLLINICLFIIACGPEGKPDAEKESDAPKKAWAIALHGGAGGISPERLGAARTDAYTKSLNAALSLGESMLTEGQPAIEVVEAVIKTLENDSLFNAGRGAVLTDEGHCELDASIMDGRSRNCGAVTGIQNIKNPIMAARLVMDSSKHVFFSGVGSTAFAIEHGLEQVDSTYFITTARMAKYQKAKGIAQADIPKEWKYGTVGCVVLDQQGDLVAGTSTGGTFLKQHGRIGDSPVIGAGNYADNNSCAVSCTGTGEYFIRAAVAHDMSARMIYADQSLDEAADAILHETLVEMGGSGGLIAVDKDGNIAMDFNTKGMYRACADSEGLRSIELFGKEN